jgi:hypothetical protein
VLKIKFFDIEFHFFSLKGKVSKVSKFFKVTLRFDGFFTMISMCYGTPCTGCSIFTAPDYLAKFEIKVTPVPIDPNPTFFKFSKSFWQMFIEKVTRAVI